MNCYLRAWLIIAAFYFSGCAGISGKADIKNIRPNIILILADDLGYGDVGCYGNTSVPTPNIDRLSSEGIRFTDAHVTCPVCGPSRVGILGGIYQQRIGCFSNTDLWPSNGWQIPDSILLLPQAMKNAGYVTGHIGKWNVSADPSLYVDEAYDVMLWKGAYYPDSSGIYPGVDAPNFRIEPHGWGPPPMGGEYLTDRLTRHAVEFLDKHRDDLFFLYLAYNAVHSPLQADIRYKDIFINQKDEPNRIYAGMIASLDENIGKLMAKLQELKLDQKTIVVFTSDNGPARGGKYIPGWPEDWPETLMGSAGNLRGHKAQLFEGGHREPLIIRWPPVLGSGKVFEKPVSTLDLYPTLCEVAGAVPSGKIPLDGVSLLPFLKEETNSNPHNELYWMTDRQGAVRAGDWKLIIESDGGVQLYNLADDIGENIDIVNQHPQVAENLLKSWSNWNTRFPDPFTELAKMKADPAK
ncbi:MAG TPA: sulfatase-like hydrolase/transferase [Cyclobacteriaceae bacterium]|nr:sulfatase-like hydrolase/transferase [Cyclobacteriaceae bacterium]